MPITVPIQLMFSEGGDKERLRPPTLKTTQHAVNSDLVCSESEKRNMPTYWNGLFDNTMRDFVSRHNETLRDYYPTEKCAHCDQPSTRFWHLAKSFLEKQEGGGINLLLVAICDKQSCWDAEERCYQGAAIKYFRRLTPLLPPREPLQEPSKPMGRNALCPCGSKDKYKKCCGNPKRLSKPNPFGEGSSRSSEAKPPEQPSASEESPSEESKVQTRKGVPDNQDGTSDTVFAPLPTHKDPVVEGTATEPDGQNVTGDTVI
jgi:hypothetical protein